MLYSNLQRDFLFFVFIWLTIMLYRAGFLFLFRDLLAQDTSARDLLLTLWYGGRISLKSAAAFTLVPFVFSTLLPLALAAENKIRLWWGYFSITLLSFLFQFRLPYYKEFGNAFDIFLFNTFNDDVWAIVDSAVKQYNAPLRLLAGAVCAGTLCFIFKKYSAIKTFRVKKPRVPFTQILAAVLTTGLIFCFALFMRFGGSFNYDKGIYWKNAARMDQHLLNEAVYDDIQALYRARKTYQYISKTKFEDISAGAVRAAAARLGGAEYNHDSLLPLLRKTAGGAKIERPRHIFFIVGETYMLWPLLPEYEYLSVADGVKSLIESGRGALIKNFLPASYGTMPSVTALILGMADLTLFPNLRASAREEFETSLARTMQNLGYGANFFYGGFASWENAADFAKNQGFENSFFYGGLQRPKNAWGIEDKYFFDEIINNFDNSWPSFNFILTSSNHPPLTVPVGEEKKKEIAVRLSEKLRSDDELITKLAHFEYADREITRFVKHMEEKFPGSLFIITGDHAQRWHINPDENIFENTAVPLVFYGAGISKNLWGAAASGSHIDIAPTITELIAPKGFEYFSLGENITTLTVGVSSTYWISGGEMGAIDEKDASGAKTQRAKDKQTVSYWRVMYGPELK